MSNVRFRRKSNVFNLGGVKIKAELIEAVSETVDGVEETAAFLFDRQGYNSELFVFAKITPGSDKVRIYQLIKDACLKSINQAAVPKKILFVDGIPRTPTGKPDRERCKEIVLNGIQQKIGQFNADN